MTLDQLRRSVRLAPGEVNQLLRLFDLWPIPADDTVVELPAAAGVWFCDVLSTLGVLDASLRLEALRHLVARLRTLGDDITERKNYEAATVRIADRRYLATEGALVDLLTGHTVDPATMRPVEKTIYDLGAIVARKRRE